MFQGVYGNNHVTHRCFWCRRKQDSQSQMSKSCRLRSSMCGASSIESSYHKGRLSSRKSKRRFCATYAKCSVGASAIYITTEVCEKRWTLWQDKSCLLTWQCACSQHPEHRAVPGREEHHCNRVTSSFNWSCFVGLFSFSEVQRDHQENSFWTSRDHQESRNNGLKEHSRRILSAA